MLLGNDNDDFEPYTGPTNVLHDTLVPPDASASPPMSEMLEYVQHIPEDARMRCASGILENLEVCEELSETVTGLPVTRQSESPKLHYHKAPNTYQSHPWLSLIHISEPTRPY